MRSSLKLIRDEVAARMDDYAMQRQPPDVYRHFINRAQRQVWLDILPIAVLGDQFVATASADGEVGKYKYAIPKEISKLACVMLKYADGEGYEAEKRRIAAKHVDLVKWRAVVSETNLSYKATANSPIYAVADAAAWVAPAPSASYENFIEFLGWRGPRQLVNDDDEADYPGEVESCVIDMAVVYMSRLVPDARVSQEEVASYYAAYMNSLAAKYGTSPVYAEMMSAAKVL